MTRSCALEIDHAMKTGRFRGYGEMLTAWGLGKIIIKKTAYSIIIDKIDQFHAHCSTLA